MGLLDDSLAVRRPARAAARLSVTTTSLASSRPGHGLARPRRGSDQSPRRRGPRPLLSLPTLMRRRRVGTHRRGDPSVLRLPLVGASVTSRRYHRVLCDTLRRPQWSYAADDARCAPYRLAQGQHQPTSEEEPRWT